LQAAARRRLGAVDDPPGIPSQLRAGTPSSRRQEKRQRREQEGQAAGVIGDVAHPGATLAEEGTAQTDENPATANTVAPTAIPHAFVGRSTTAATPHASTEAITASGTAASRHPGRSVGARAAHKERAGAWPAPSFEISFEPAHTSR